MKKQIAFLSVLMSISLISCAPQDREVVSKEKRDEILAQKGGGGAAKPGQVRLGSYGFTAFLLEKQGEIVQLLALSSADSGSTRGGYTIREETSRIGEVRSLNLESLNTEVKNPDVTTTQNVSWEVYIRRQSSFKAWTEAAVLKTTNSKSEAGLIAGEFQEATAQLSASPLNDGSGLHQISYSSKGVLSATVGAVTEVLPFSLTIDFQTDLKELNAAEFKLVKTTISFVTAPRVGDNKVFAVKIGAATEELKFVNSADCPRVLGAAIIDPENSNPKNRKKAVFTDATYDVPGFKYTKQNAACGSRPLVDLHRGLLYN